MQNRSFHNVHKFQNIILYMININKFFFWILKWNKEILRMTCNVSFVVWCINYFFNKERRIEVIWEMIRTSWLYLVIIIHLAFFGKYVGKENIISSLHPGFICDSSLMKHRLRREKYANLYTVHDPLEKNEES